MDCMNSFMNICRLCLKPDQGEIFIFSNVPTESSTLYDKINVCLPVRISQNDDLPKKICRTCLETVDFIFGFWQLSSSSEKQLQSMLNAIKEENAEIIIQDSSVEWPAKDAVVLLDTSSNRDLMMDSEDLADIDDSNIEIREVYFGDCSNQNAYVEDDVDTIVEIPAETVTNKSFGVPLEQSLLNSDITEATSISQIVESSNVSLRTFEAEDSLKLKFWDVTLPKFFLIPYNYPADKTIDSNTIVLMDISNPEATEPVGTKPYACDVCETVCEDQLSFLKHYENDHKLYKCPFCVKRFGRRYVLENHLLVHSTRKDFACPICKAKFKRQAAVREHIKGVHGRNDNMQLFECDECAYRTKHKRLIKVHVLAHLGISLYSCSLCGKKFKSNSDLITHQNWHMGIKPYQCDVCGNHFTRKHYMLTHRKLLHEELSSYQCDVCGKSFSYKNSLVSHLQLHTGENRVQCDVCNKIVSSKASLINHRKMHVDSNEFVCGVCGKAYFNKYSLQEHVLVHTGSKPFQCFKCDKTFSMRKKLLNHEQIHSEFRLRFSCSFCDKSYLAKFKLKEHIQKHHMSILDDG